MRRYLLIIASAAMMLFAGCTKSNIDSTSNDNNLNKPGDGKVTLALNLRLKGSNTQIINSKAGSNWSEKENVTSIKGYAFVFSEDPATANGYGDNSELLQKIPFKTIVSNSGSSDIYVTLDEYEGGCFIKLITSMTQSVEDQVKAFNSQKEIDAGDKSGAVTKFVDYKHISVNLSGYYNISDPYDGTPDPNSLTGNSAFPLASPGISMPNGLNDDTVEEVNKVIYMVPAASKVDVSVGSGCGFTLNTITLLNGAREARLRSTVLEDDGKTPIETLPVPVNLGGITRYAPVTAAGNTTEGTPIYFFPNEGDGPFNKPSDPDSEYPKNGTKLSDQINVKNPTYLIIKGKAAGYNVDGYYKIAIVYKPIIIGTDGQPNGTEENFTYDIIRNNHYKVNLIKVDNPGYASFDEAVDGPANDIAYDIVIDDGNSDNSDTFKDPRAETIVSHNGFFYIELVGSEVYAQGYGEDGVKGNIGLSLTSNQAATDAGYTIPDLAITTYGNITVDKTSVQAGFAGTIGFTAKGDGHITLRCGDMEKVIQVHYRQTPHVYGSGTTIGGQTLGKISEFVADASGYKYTKSEDLINAEGNVSENTIYKNREFRGKAYPVLMSRGIYKVYVAQASNFDLNTYYDNSAASATGGNSGTEIFKTTSTNVYEVDINYQSTGKVYQINAVNKGTLNNKGTMDEWWIGAAPIEFTADGDFTSKFTGSISDSFTKYSWSNLTNGSKVTLDAGNIGSNQGSTYDEDKTKISNTATLVLTNIAGETKTYKIVLNQYAAPYISGDVTYDEEDDAYYWTSTTPADCSSKGSGGSNVDGSLGNSPTVYNAHYIAGEQKDGGDYVWREAPDSDNGEYKGGSTGLANVSDGVAPQSVNPSTNAWYFYGKVNSRYWSKKDGKWQAYFDLRITNDANEEIHFIITYRRDDSSK